MARASGISDPAESADPEYTEGLGAAVCAAVSYGIEALERGEDRAPPIPVALLSQARLAARNRVSLDVVLRRYFAGYTLLGGYVIEEAGRGGLRDAAAMGRLMRVQESLFDRVVAAVSDEYGREAVRPSSAEERRAELVTRLLEGETFDVPELSYEFDAHHLGVLAKGPQAPEALRELATVLDTRLLLVGRSEAAAAWAWFGARRPLGSAQLLTAAASRWPSQVFLAIGEPGEGLEGWRLSHRQAAAALPIAMRGTKPIVRYAEVALLAAIFHDSLLATSLRQLYLAPLERERDGGKVLRETLRAYFAAERNISSAAAALGISRQAVAKRLRSVEAQLGRPLGECAAELEALLRLQDADRLTTRN